MAGVVVYVSSVSSNMQIRKEQSHIKQVLEGKKIDHKEIDITTSEDFKKEMKELAGPTSLPPQIANGGVYCGNYDAFDEAVECETLSDFLKL